MAHPWEKGKSPWEFLVIQDYRTESEPRTPRMALYLRHHHALIDGYGLVSLLEQLSSCAVSLPAAEIFLHIQAAF